MEESSRAKLANMEQNHGLHIKQLQESSRAKLAEEELRITKEKNAALCQKEEQLQKFIKANADFAKENAALAEQTKDQAAKLKESERQNRVLRQKLEDTCASS